MLPHEIDHNHYHYDTAQLQSSTHLQRHLNDEVRDDVVNFANEKLLQRTNDNTTVNINFHRY